MPPNMSINETANCIISRQMGKSSKDKSSSIFCSDPPTDGPLSFHNLCLEGETVLVKRCASLKANELPYSNSISVKPPF